MRRTALPTARRLHTFWLAALLLLLVPLQVRAQGTTGRLTGQVTSAGQPLAGVSVQLAQLRRAAVTDAEGRFVLLGIPPGRHDVQFNRIGYRSVEHRQVPIVIDQATRLDVELETSAVSLAPLIVQSDVHRIEPEVSSARVTLQPEQLKELPTVRMEHSLGLQAGIEYQQSQHYIRFENGQSVSESGNQPRGLRVRGGNVSETALYLDGFSLQDRHSDWAYLGVNRSALQQIQLQLGGFDAAVGNVRSGLVQVISREGRPDRFTAVGELRFAPPQQKHFGPSLADTSHAEWRTFAGPYALDGVPADLVGTPDYPIAFEGWRNVRVTNAVWGEDRLTPEGLLELWKWQHRPMPYADDPDYEVDVGFGGPTFLPWNTTFWVSGRMKRSWYPYPTGENPYAQENNFQLRLAAQPSSALKFGITALRGSVQAHTLAPNFGLYSTQDGDVQFGIQPVQVFESIYDRGSWLPLQREMTMLGFDLTHRLTESAFWQLRLAYRDNRTDQQPIGIKMVRYPANEQPFPGFNDQLTPALYLPTKDGGQLPIYDWQNGHNIWFQQDVLRIHAIQGRGRFFDLSRNTTLSGSMSVSWQAAQHHLLGAGLELDLFTEDYHSMRYTELRHQVQPLHNNYRHEMFNEQPLQVGAYIKDQLEYEGLVLSVGARLDHFNARTSWYPTTGAARFDSLYNSVRFWVDPDDGTWIPDWYKQTEHRKTAAVSAKTRISPRLGLSFPISDRAKLFANYGHFYQAPRFDYLYTTAIAHNRQGALTLGNPDLDLLRTVSYEAGAQFVIPRVAAAQASVYFKQVDNEVATTAYRSTATGANYNMYDNKGYRDVRGFDVQLTRSFGRSLRGFLAYNYVQTSHGRRGYSQITDDPATNSEIQRLENAEQGRPIPGPSARGSLTYETASCVEAGLAAALRCGWRVTGLYQWRDGGLYEWPDRIDGKTMFVDVRDWSNTNITIERELRVRNAEASLFLDIINVFNQKTLAVDAYNAPTMGNGKDYRDSLKLPFLEGDRKGNDAYGDWDRDYIALHWSDWSRFINPRWVSLGVRFGI